MPPVSRYMTWHPITISPHRPMSEAHRLMRERGVRHLPVVDDGRLVGVVSDRDLHLMESLRDVDPDEVAVGEAMSPHVRTAAPDAPLEEVVELMATAKLGSVVVVGRHGIEGIFTAIDALYALAELLDRQVT